MILFTKLKPLLQLALALLSLLVALFQACAHISLLHQRILAQDHSFLLRVVHRAVKIYGRIVNVPFRALCVGRVSIVAIQWRRS